MPKKSKRNRIPRSKQKGAQDPFVNSFRKQIKMKERKVQRLKKQLNNNKVKRGKLEAELAQAEKKKDEALEKWADKFLWGIRIVGLVVGFLLLWGLYALIF